MLLKVGKDKYLTYATRDDWGAHRFRLKPAKLYTPVDWVRFSCTGTSECNDPYSCGKMVRAIQETFLDNGFWDIPYNFLVGGDGVVYEARSWSFQPDLPEELCHLEDDCVDIAYIGDFAAGDPSWEMIKTALNFVIYGVTRLRDIRPTFQVIPYRKIQSTKEAVKSSS